MQVYSFHMAELYLGMARARLGPAAALIDAERGAIAACEENRLTRARQASTAGPPELAVAELLRYLDRPPAAIATTAIVSNEDGVGWSHDERALRLDSHQAHGAYAFHASALDDALVLVCETHRLRGWTAWRFNTAEAQPRQVAEDIGDFPIARIYGQLTGALGLQPTRDEHLVEAMARAGRDTQGRIAAFVSLESDGVRVNDRFRDEIRAAVANSDEQTRNDIAASVQRRLGECFLELLRTIAALPDGSDAFGGSHQPPPRTRRSAGALAKAEDPSLLQSELGATGGTKRVCLSGGLFFNTYFTTIAATSGAFEEVHVPPHPGRNGTALGAALITVGATRARVPTRAIGSPYLGPGYSAGEIKEVLDNCKLLYDFIPGDRLNDAVIQALSRGRLVGWFHGRLEWGPRALGHRSVLADPFAPHVLDNLNGFLKRRPAYRSYGVSVPLSRLDDFFENPKGLNLSMSPAVVASPLMQYEYRPRDPEKFKSILPDGVETLRVHTVDESETRFLRLLELWGEKTGTPVLVNTSFNGFHEPLVCSPRDAIRVFYGTGLDVLALEDFFLHK